MDAVNPLQQQPSGAQSMGGMHTYHKTKQDVRGINVPRVSRSALYITFVFSEIAFLGFHM